MLKKLIVIVIGVLVITASFFLGWWWRGQRGEDQLLSPIAERIEKVRDKPLGQYTFESLKSRSFSGSEMVLEEVVAEEEKFTSYLFAFTVEGKKVTGQVNIPVGNGPFPVVVMLRGWVDPEVYETGVGTRRAAVVLAENGCITLAPDFLGYGGSDVESENVFEARFQKTTTALELLASIKSLAKADINRIGIWGHSNGGQIALAVLGITGKSYPTSLWAPVSKPFPYSILYYTDEAEDHGKELRKMLAQFEADYDASLYSVSEYYDWIEAPLQIHQGTADEAVPVEWSAELVNKLKGLDKDVVYYQYVGADHNLRPSWDIVIDRDLAFFRRHLELK